MKSQSGPAGLGPAGLGPTGLGPVGLGPVGPVWVRASVARSRSLPTCVAAPHLPKGLGQVLEVVQAAVVLAVQQDLLGVREEPRDSGGGGGEEQEVRSSRSWRQDRRGGRVVYGAGPDSHGVVEVGDPARGLARGWTSETRVVGVAQDPLQPRQSTSRGQCLVREVTCGVRGQGSEVSITATTTTTTGQ